MRRKAFREEETCILRQRAIRLPFASAQRDDEGDARRTARSVRVHATFRCRGIATFARRRS
jgi:hypothetical protein